MAETDLIWHFTGAQALYPILRADGGLLATHQAFMNDASDCAHSRRVNQLMAKLLDHMIDAPDHELPNEYVEYKSGLRVGVSHSFFLACFSTEYNNPLLWRCYTPQGGFAIGISKAEFQTHLEYSTKQLCAVRRGVCSYDCWEETLHRVNALEETFNKRIERLTHPDCSAEEKAKILMESTNEELELEKDLAFVKHPFFETESEYRVLYAFKDPVPIADLIVLDGKPRIKILLSVPFSSLVRRILVSPLGNKDANLQLAQLLATSIGLPLASVESYDAPVR